jgi:pimeloyl-ACP methyl ester carboxylesterase
MANFVLIHGGWRGSLIWRKVARRLRKEGHEVYAPTLTGIADRSHLFDAGVNLSTHIQDVVSLIQYEDLNDVVLCGASYGGMVITGVADQISERIAALVHLEGLLAQDGESGLTLVPEALQTAIMNDAALHGGYSVSPLTPDTIPTDEKNPSPVDRGSPQPLATMTEAIRLKGNHNKIKTKIYLMSTSNPFGFSKFYDRVKNDPAWIARTIDCGHDIAQEKPEEVVELLKEVAVLVQSK